MPANLRMVSTYRADQHVSSLDIQTRIRWWASARSYTLLLAVPVIPTRGCCSLRNNLRRRRSVSVTMNQDDLKAITTIVASPAFGSDRLWLNGVEENVGSNGRVQDVLREIRARCGGRADSSGRVVPPAELAGWRVHIVSRNTFPTAAGLASSAAGYACLVHTLADVYGVKESYAGVYVCIGSALRVGFCSRQRQQYT